MTSVAASAVPDEPVRPAPPKEFKPDRDFVREREALYEEVTASHPTHKGKELSTAEREAKGIKTTSTLTYGEIRFEPFALAFQKIRDLYGGLQTPGTHKFVDLGSGTGKPVFAAALLHPWRQCVGIELLDSLYTASVEMLETSWKAPSFQESLPEDIRAVVSLPVRCLQCAAARPPQGHVDPSTRCLLRATGFPMRCLLALCLHLCCHLLQDVHFEQGDITKLDWSDADVIFANSTCFDADLMAAIAIVADRMRVGSFCVTFTRQLPSAKWSVLESNVEMMSWGGATVFIHRKVLE